MSNETNVAGGSRRKRSPWVLPGVFLLVGLLGAGWGYFSARASEGERQRTANALQLQVLASRLGVAAFEAEYGDFTTARRVASEEFDGIANYGIEQGALPQDYAQVLTARDDVIAGLATRDPAVAEKMMALFFGLQVPVDTELDPSHIVPAADSGLGLDPPIRAGRAPAADTAGRTTPPDTARRAAPIRPGAADTAARRPASVRRDTLPGGGG